MRVLITGAGGFVGSHLLETVLSRGDEVVCVDSLAHNGASERIAAVTTSSSPVTMIRHDLSARFSLAALRRIGHIDHILDAASMCQVDQSIAIPDTFISNNVEAVLTILEFARYQQGLRGLIHLSTDEVYGDHVPHSASDHRPSSPYAASKAAQEDICAAYARTYGLPVTIVNSCNMFGERQSLLAFIPRVIRSLLNGTKPRVHAHNGVPGRRRYSYAGNVAERLADVMQDGCPGGRLWLGGQQELSNIEVVERVAEKLSMDAVWELVDVDAIRPGYDESYSMAAAWEPRLSFDEGLDRTITWVLHHREELM